MEKITKTNPFNSFVQMITMLPDDAACRKYLEQILWNGTPTCPHCGLVDKTAYILKKPGQYKCRGCQKRFTVSIGTMFEGSHIGFKKWFIAIYIFSSHKKIPISGFICCRTLFPSISILAKPAVRMSASGSTVCKLASVD